MCDKESGNRSKFGRIYSIYHKYSDRQAWAKSVDPDEMLHNMVSH